MKLRSWLWSRFLPHIASFALSSELDIFDASLNGVSCHLLFYRLVVDDNDHVAESGSVIIIYSEALRNHCLRIQV